MRKRVTPRSQKGRKNPRDGRKRTHQNKPDAEQTVIVVAHSENRSCNRFLVATTTEGKIRIGSKIEPRTVKIAIGPVARKILEGVTTRSEAEDLIAKRSHDESQMLSSSQIVKGELVVEAIFN
ncbi:MAG: hypothetical protein ABH837_03590 [bacterium]